VHMHAHPCICMRIRAYACASVHMHTHPCTCIRIRAYAHEVELAAQDPDTDWHARARTSARTCNQHTRTCMHISTHVHSAHTHSAHTHVGTHIGTRIATPMSPPRTPTRLVRARACVLSVRACAHACTCVHAYRHVRACISARAVLYTAIGQASRMERARCASRLVCTWRGLAMVSSGGFVHISEAVFVSCSWPVNLNVNAMKRLK